MVAAAIASLQARHISRYRAIGIPPDLAYEVEKRRVHVTRDGKGQAVKELFA